MSFHTATRANRSQLRLATAESFISEYTNVPSANIGIYLLTQPNASIQIDPPPKLTVVGIIYMLSVCCRYATNEDENAIESHGNMIDTRYSYRAYKLVALSENEA